MIYYFDTYVYYEDTDAGGVVYHAKYLHFLERARTDLLASYAVNQKKLIDEQHIMFVVRSCNINFFKPARLCDQLRIATQIKTLKKASLVFSQDIYREDEHLLSADVAVVSIDSETTKIKRFPDSLINIFQNYILS